VLVLAVQVEKDLPVGKAAGVGVRPVHHQRGLADPAEAGHDHHPRLRARLVDRPGQRRQLGVAPGEVPDPGGQLGRPRPARRRRPAAPGRHGRPLGLPAQDLCVQPAQVGARLAADLLDQPVAQLLIHPQRIGLPIVAVQREHQLPGQALAQRVGRDGRGQLRDQVGVQAQAELGVEEVLQQAGPHLGQPDPVGLHPRRGDPVQRIAAPQLQRGPQRLGRPRRVGGQARLPEQVVQPLDVGGAAGRIEQIPGVAGDEDVTHLAAQLGDQPLQPGPGRRRRPAAPQGIDQPLGGNDLPGRQGQHGERIAL
jgi:hypothetical protein